MEWFAEYRSYLLAGLAAGAVLLALKALRYVLIFRAVTKTPVALDRAELVPADAIPEEERAILQADAAALIESGFVFQCAMRTHTRAGANVVQLHSEVYFHPETKTYASIRVNREAWIKLPCLSNFVNYLRDGSHVETMSHALFVFPTLPPRIQLDAPLFGSIRERWAYHRSRVEGRAGQCLAISPAGGIALMRSHGRELTSHLLRHRLLRKTSEDDAYHYTFRGARAVTRAILAEVRRWQKFAPGQPGPMSPEQEALAFEHAQQMETGRTFSRIGKLVLLLASAALFSVAFGAAFSWELVPILLAVLLLHEMGHFLAMKAFGYRDLSIFFIPLLGAATAGKKADARPMQKVLVYLAGPVPGLVLGVAAWYGGPLLNMPALTTFAIAALVLNLLNLLPLSPLDGGRIVEVLWLERFPRIRVGFMLASVTALAGLALVFEDFILGGLAGLLSLSVPAEWRFAILMRALHGDRLAAGNSVLPGIFARMNEIYSAKTHAIERHAIAKRALETLQASPPRLATSIVGTMLYLGSFALPIVAAIALAIGLSHASQLNSLPAASGAPVQESAAPD